MRTYTFVCLGENQVAVTVDVQALAGDTYRAHALQLLRDHASVAAVEIWSDEAIVDALARDGVRPWPRGEIANAPPAASPDPGQGEAGSQA